MYIFQNKLVRFALMVVLWCAGFLPGLLVLKADSVLGSYHWLHLIWGISLLAYMIFFTLLDEAYAKLYGVVPFTEKMKKSIIADFKLIIDPKYILIINDENEKTVAFGLCFPALGDALLHTGGKLGIRTILKVLNAVKNPTSADLGLIACDFEYLNKGIIAPIIKKIMDLLKDGNVKYVETNLNLEDNVKVRQVWKYFHERQHKRRRSFIKNI